MNACGVLAEIVAGIPIMGSFHGSYSVAAAVGSLLGASLASAGWSSIEIFVLVTLCSIVSNFIATLSLYNKRQ